ncbi:facilitated trehalose transporter Tret1-2 homolog [Bombus pyrosoma]|uniref:facilitated trehalose transporter Tret1-2 homolog n=1 Tax=Bombus pyrosoma TaxID=396416 RepID=UPI001CB9A259|nr:facilitated trehalose transporter Tret1-2 homolog [Bombus pyrosoma]
MLGLIMAQQFSGNFITMQYLNVLFSKIPISIGPNVATLMVLSVGLITSSLISLIVECLKRRELLILSGFGTCLTLCILGIYLLLDQQKFDVSNASILPVIDLIIYQIMYQIGLGTLPNLLLCELFPAELKRIVGPIIVIFDGIIGFMVPKLYQGITNTDGLSAIYIVFAAVSSSVFLMLFIYIPETKGKTYREIEALLLKTYLSS